ncbi:thiol peroxidase [Ulvibacterium sp.]|uniref:thiol peroxidase n=1 Tax=Ulvibacterium sp. TaxID=2665914 RepID=UPI00262AFB9F|nr:thiol peroxidase [Ulvibacterium sp.]
MATVTLKGNEIHTIGNLPSNGGKAPDFKLTKTDLSDTSLSDYSGKKVVLNIFPSIDTGTCAQSVRQFNEEAAELDNTVVLCISKDLPFAQTRFCGAEGIENVVMLSDFRDGSFGKDYEVEFTDGPLRSLLSRAVVVLDEDGNVQYTEQVPETVDEPNYKAALEALMDA